MNVQQAYNEWAEQYDTNLNRTRDLEAVSLRTTLAEYRFENCLEIGCGTGKNTEWLMTKATELVAVDFSEEMLDRARAKLKNSNLSFVQADITQAWTFADRKFDLVTFSLVLEHIEDIESIFQKLNSVTHEGSLVYMGELHPYKQYSGSKARFETAAGVNIVICFTHHLSEFTNAAAKSGFEILSVMEYFDEDAVVPRILTILFRKRD